ncbi:MAG: hypothetical protein V1844_09525 [Pseudomonadota bacterium]
MAIQTVVDQIIAGNLHEALVGCWRYFISDFPRFQEAETHALGSEEKYRCFKKKLADLFIENEKLKLHNLTIDFPLAILEVLDQYIFERFNRMGNPPAARVKIDSEFYYVHRRGKEMTPVIVLTSWIHPSAWWASLFVWISVKRVRRLTIFGQMWAPTGSW